MGETATNSVTKVKGDKPAHFDENGKTPNCLNCGMPLSGESFCPNCGQNNDSRKLPAWKLFTEGISGFFSVDSKVFRSFRPMLTKPRQIVLNYTAGKRATYLHPARMYLSVSIIFFLLQSILSGSAVQIEPVESDLDQEKEDIVVFFEPDSLSQNEYSRIAFYVQKHPRWSWEQVKEASGVRSGFWKEFYHLHAQKMMNMEWASFMDYLKSKMPLILFLILPVLALILKLFYLRKGIYYVDHLIFAFYTQSALFMLLTIGIVLDTIFGTSMELLFSILLFFYLYFSLRRVYSQSRLVTFVKLGAISIVYITSGLMFMFLAGAFLFLWY